MNSNIIKCCILLCLLFVQASCSGSREKKEAHVSEVTNPLPIKLGDPFILHASDGKYYMYGTSLPNGFEAYVSTDLSQWTACGQVYKGGGEEQWNVDCFWAPEVYERNGKYYMFYSANSRNNPTNEGENFKLGVAVSLSPVGPFTDLYNRPIFEVDYPVIDANVYFDDANGKTYLYYSRCCYKHPVESEIAEQMKREGVYDEIEESWVYGVEMKPDFSGIVGEPVLLLAPPTRLADRQAEWESRSVTSHEVNRRWTEGSFLFKHNDSYYIMYTAPSYEAMIYDVKKTKDWGFNMIRKHVKVEPALWYTYCDRIGMIVWQDMPSSEKCCEWQNRNYFEGTEFARSAESEANYRREWKEIMDYLYSYPCISTWVPFNEAWGQFKTVEITEWTQQYDPSRLVNSASGGNFFMCGDILDLHHYPGPSMYLFDAHRANVLGEYGGIGYPMEGHLWAPDRNWGYIQFKSSKEVTDQYVEYAEQLLDLIERGFTGAVYTQTTDVEIEVNGIMTYDRKVIKMDEDRIREINSRICHSLDK